MVSRNRGKNFTRRHCEDSRRSVAGRGNPGHWDDPGSPRRPKAPSDDGVARSYAHLVVSQEIIGNK